MNFKGAICLATSALALTLAGCTSHSTVHASAPTGVKNVLLVHGAWSDGSSWNQVIAGLSADGYNVTAVQLPLTSLADDAAVLQRALDRETGKTILVGHSYGGVVITQAGNDPKVAGLVYVAAYAPDAGESVDSLNNSVPPTPISKDLLVDKVGYVTLSSTGVSSDFAPDIPAAQQTTIVATQGPTSYPGALTASVTETAWKSHPSWYAISSNDRVISPALETSMAKRMNATTITLQSGHLAMLSHPSEVTNLIETAATSLTP